MFIAYRPVFVPFQLFFLMLKKLLVLGEELSRRRAFAFFHAVLFSSACAFHSDRLYPIISISRSAIFIASAFGTAGPFAKAGTGLIMNRLPRIQALKKLMRHFMIPPLTSIMVRTVLSLKSRGLRENPVYAQTADGIFLSILLLRRCIDLSSPLLS